MNNKFDERQLLVRGKVFMFGFIYLGIYMLLNALIRDNGILWADEPTAAVLGIMSAVCICSVILILKDAYSAPNSNMWTVAVVIMSIAAVVSLLCGIDGWIVNGFVEKGTITIAARTTLLGVFFLIISCVYWVKKFLDKREESN